MQICRCDWVCECMLDVGQRGPTTLAYTYASCTSLHMGVVPKNDTGSVCVYVLALHSNP